MRVMRVALAVMAMVVLTGAVATAQMRGLGAVNGVVESEAGEPVSGVSIKFLLSGGEAIEGKSDGSGKWRILGVGKGEWKVEFAASGYATRLIKFVVERETMNGDAVKIVRKKA
jgi:hypothetical protein